MFRGARSIMFSMHGATRRRWTFLLACLVVGAVFFQVQHSTDFIYYQAKDTAFIEAQVNSVLAGNSSRQIAFLALAIFGSIALFVAKDQRVVPVNLLGVLIAAYLLWLTLSFFWSSSPFLSAKRIFIVYLMSVGALGLSRVLSIRDVWYLVLVISGSYLLIGIAVEVAYGMFTPWSSDHRFGGTLHPNAQGLNLSLLILAGVCLRIRAPASTRLLWMGFFFAAVLFLLMTKSRTALISLLIALTYYSLLITLARRGWLTFALLTSLMLAASCLVIWVESASPFINDLISTGRPESDSSTFTGRTELWKIILPDVWKKPLLGYGYSGYWLGNVDVISDDMAFGVFNSHSAYIETALSLGLVGLVLLLALLFGGIIHATVEMRRRYLNEYAGIAALLIYTLPSGFLESTLIEASLLNFVVMTAIATLAFPPVDAGRVQIEPKTISDSYWTSATHHDASPA